MDSTELHYVTYDPDAIWKEMMLAYITAGGDVLYPGDEKEMLLRSVQADIVQVFAGVDNALRMQTLRYAVGDYLAGAQYVPFGEAPLVGYLAARETEYTNLRILLLGRSMGLPADVIRSRLRASYV